MAPDCPSPSRELLPPFRVRQVRLPADDAIVRMKRVEYDDLLKRQPDAALRYIDESDGEVILVGSSLELSQRLDEPVDPSPNSYPTTSTVAQSQTSKYFPLHTFEVTNAPSVLSEWRSLDDRTTEEGKKARSVFFGAHDVPKKTEKDPMTAMLLEQQNKEKLAMKLQASAQPAAPATKIYKPPVTMELSPDDQMRVMLLEQQNKKSEMNKYLADLKKHEEDAKQRLYRTRLAVRFEEQEDSRVMGENMLEQKRHMKREDASREKAAARTAGVRFGQTSPPRNHLDSSKKSESHPTSDGNRWATYSQMPDKFNKALAALHEAAQEAKETKPSPKSAFDVMTAAAADQHVRSHTVQVPSTPKQKKEHQPLLEMFWATKSQQSASKTEEAKKDYQPLLELFEKQLHQLGNGTPASQTSTQPPKAVPQTQREDSRPKQNQPLQTPGELLTLSIQSLLSGVSDLASAFKLTSSELQQQIAHARRDFPKNMDQALKASIGAIDTLRSELSAPRSQPASQQSDRGTQASKPAMSDHATNTDKSTKKEARTADKGANSNLDMPSSNPAPFNKQELIKQDKRIDAVVETMRLALLDVGWRAPATAQGIYTRADVLEEFLCYFNTMQSLAEFTPPKRNVIDWSKADARFQAPPPVPAKEPKKESKTMKDDLKLPADWPYAWDFKFPANDDGATTKVEGDDRSEYQSFLWDDAAEYQYQPLAQSETFPARPAEVNHSSVQKDTLQAWRPLVPSTAGYQFNPESVMSTTPSTPERSDRNILAAKYPTFESYMGPRKDGNLPIAGLADESVMDKFPTVAQFEQRGMQKQAFTKPQPIEPKVSPPTPPSFTKLPHLGDWKNAQPKQNLSAQKSMPVLKTAPARQQPIESKPRELYAGFPFQAEGTSKAPNTLYKSASMSFKPASHREEHVKDTRRSNTVRESSTINRDAAGRARTAATSRSIRRAEEADRNREIQASNNIEECRRRLVEMGFMVTEARRVSTEAHGDLEKAIDMMEEEARKRKADKGKGRYMPGAYDDELFG